jgi:hypothetical protein
LVTIAYGLSVGYVKPFAFVIQKLGCGHGFAISTQKLVKVYEILQRFELAIAYRPVYFRHTVVI